MNTNAIYGVIYKTECQITGDTYIGQTAKNISVNSGYMGSGIHIKYAIAHYGVENFTRTNLIYCISKEQMNRMEKLFIKLLCPTYNIASGGQGGNLGDEVNKKISRKAMGNKYATGAMNNATRVKLSIAHMGKPKKKWSQETKDRVSAMRKLNPIKRKPMSQQGRENISRARKAKHKHYTEEEKLVLSEKSRAGWARKKQNLAEMERIRTMHSEIKSAWWRGHKNDISE